MGRKQNVLAVLTVAKANGWVRVEGTWVRAEEGWVPGHVLASKTIGGSEGLRRLRELRDDGVPIEKRKPKGRTWEYRIGGE